MRLRSLRLVVVLLLLPMAPAWAQRADGLPAQPAESANPARPARLDRAGKGSVQSAQVSIPPGKVSTQRWRIGTILVANGGAFRSINCTVTVPMDWPEQRVRIVDEDLSPGVKVSYRPVEDLGRQMAISIPHLAPGAEARAVVTFEVKRLYRAAPEDTDTFVSPNPRRLDRKLAAFLAPSPYIESNSPEIAAAAAAVDADTQKAWDRVEAIYNWVRKKIQYEDNQGRQILSAVEALRAGKGDCDEITSLFVAVCRASGIPARTVRVPGHVYPEFYLLDKEGEGYWFPCQSAGTPSFGSMPDLRPILQKGDNVLLPDPRTKKKVRYRFFPENVVGFPVGSGGSLEQKMVCEREKDN